jgi:hypothetical protein
MDEQTGRRPAEEAAQYLANLLGTSVADAIPEQSKESVDLELEFFRNNVSIAALVLLSGLLKGNNHLKQELLGLLQPSHFWDKSIERFLFLKIKEHLQANDSSELDLEICIQEYGLSVWGKPQDERSLANARFKLSQILGFEPTENQVYRAFQLRREWALRRGFISD